MPTVLVVDDDERIRSLLVRALRTTGYVVSQAANGREAITALETRPPDLMLLDLVMPHVNGLQVLAQARTTAPGTRVIVLSGVQETGTRIQALHLGAVDVVAKPFSTAELLARVRRNLDSQSVDGTSRYLTAGSMVLDTQRRRLSIGERQASLTEREFALLSHLMSRVGEVCPREELLHDVWGMDFDPGSNVVEVNIARLRHRLPPPAQIETVRNVGYCLLPC
jgi:DNA-binding response OmpR family regulator